MASFTPERRGPSQPNDSLHAGGHLHAEIGNEDFEKSGGWALKEKTTIKGRKKVQADIRKHREHRIASSQSRI